MEIEIHLLIGSILIFALAIFLVISQYRERLPSPQLTGSVKRKTRKRERRIYPRYKTSLRIKYKTPSEEGISWVKDISRGGVRVFLNDPFRVGTSLKIEVNLPHDSSPILVQGSVVWKQEVQEDAGISFDEAEQKDINRIIRYIDNKKRIGFSRE